MFADHAAGLLFAGDHVLPTITPSIGFEPALPAQPLGDFLGSLTKVRGLPDLRLLPAHGPVADSVPPPDRRAADPPRPPARAVPRRRRRGRQHGVRRGAGAAVDPARPRLRLARPVQRRAGDAWRRGPTSSCWWRAASLTASEVDSVVVYVAASSAAGRRIGTCGIPSSRNSSPSTVKPRRAYQSARGDWASSTTSRPGQPSREARHEEVGEAAAAAGRGQHHPADPPLGAVVEHPRVADHVVALAQHHVDRAGLGVAAVEVGVGAVLLHDEDVLPQPPHGVRRGGVQLAEGDGRDGDVGALIAGTPASRAGRCAPRG